MAPAVVRTGDKFQAQIPTLLAPEQRQQLAQSTQPRYAQRWGAPPASAASTEVVAQFLQSHSRIAEGEQALECLFAGGFDAEAANVGLWEARKRLAREQHEVAQVLADDAFADAIAAHGKKFHFVKQALPGVTSTRDVVCKFYKWKTTPGYKQWRDQDRARKKKESARVLRRRWGDDSDSDAPSDYHNEFCDLCFTGGQLLCCDGCCRAFHFSCVTPPISEVPKDDWFCAQCRALLGAEAPRISPSPENRFCGIVSIGGATASMMAARKGGGSASVSSDAPDSEGEDTGSVSTDESEADSRAERPPASFTDQDESDGSEALRRRAQIRAEKAARTDTGGSATTKQRHASSVETSPAPSAASIRKRQRKLGAPRRIVLSPTHPSTLTQPKPGPSP